MSFGADVILDLSTLEPGQRLFSRSMAVSADAAASFREAVGDDGAAAAGDHAVPPMAVAAMVMGAAMEAVELPAGAVHTAQELEFGRPVEEGVMLACSATVVSNSVRRGTRFIVLEMRGDDGAETALRARATIAIAQTPIAHAQDGAPE